MANPRDFKFSATDEKLVGYYLRNRVETGKDGFIKDIELYEDEPWLLPHVNNEQFKERQWFYFVKRTRLHGKTPKRTVQGRGDGGGGTWTTTAKKKKEIIGDNKKVIGYKTTLAYYKKTKDTEDKRENQIKGIVDKGETTGWCMTEYWLNGDVFQEVVLCHLRAKKKMREEFELPPLWLIFVSRFGPVQDSMADLSDLKFSPADERLIGYYLRNRVDSGRDGFVKDIKLYEYEPWFLPHVNNDAFKEKEWFYFVVRTRSSGNRPNRIVQGRGDSLGGTWTVTGGEDTIFDSNNMVIGYKNELAYYKKVKDSKKAKGETTGWCMTEYWLESKEDSVFQEVVLCHLRDTNKNIIDDQSQLQPQIFTQDSVQVMNPNYGLIAPQDSRFMIPYGVNQLQQPQILHPEDSRLIPGEYNIVVEQPQEVSNALVPGLQNMAYIDCSFLFDLEPKDVEDENLMLTSEEFIMVLEREDPLHDLYLEFAREQQNMIPAAEEEYFSDYIDNLEYSLEVEVDQESQTHPPQDQDSRFTRDQEMVSVGKEDDDLKAYFGELENLLDKEDDKTTQQSMIPAAEEAYLSNYFDTLKNIIQGKDEDQRPQILPFQDSRDQEVPTSEEDTKEFDEHENLLEAHRTKRRKLW